MSNKRKRPRLSGWAERLPDAASGKYIAARFAGITGRERVISMMNRIF